MPTLTVGGSLTVAAAQTISGAGQINGSGNTLLNHGLVNANVAGQTLSTTVSNLLNTGSLEASNSGILLLNSTVSNSGTILASGGTVQIQSTVTGGTLTTISTSEIQLLNNSGVSTVTLSPSSLAVVPAGATATISGGMTNNGTIDVTAASASTPILQFTGTQTLSGNGSVVMGPYVNTGNLPNLTVGGSLTVAASQTISGAGQITGGGHTLFNQGLINANVAGETLSTPVSSLINSGTMEASSGGTLQVNTAVSNSGTVLASGGTVNITGTVAQISGSTLTGGTWIARGGSPLLITSAGSIATNQATVVLDGAARRSPTSTPCRITKAAFRCSTDRVFRPPAV